MLTFPSTAANPPGLGSHLGLNPIGFVPDGDGILAIGATSCSGLGRRPCPSRLARRLGPYGRLISSAHRRPTSVVDALPPRSLVLTPVEIVRTMASTTLSPQSRWPR